MRFARNSAMVLLAGVLLLHGCGVPAEGEARPVPAPARSRPSPPAVAESGPVTERLYLVKAGTLVAVQRRQPALPDAEAVMRELLAGPTDAEKAAGITSALLGSNVVASVRVSGGVATVELAAGLEGTGRNDDVLAFGQIVCTLTVRPDIGWVDFTRNRQRIEVPRGDGSLTAGPLNTESYSSLITR